VLCCGSFFNPSMEEVMTTIANKNKQPKQAKEAACTPDKFKSKSAKKTTKHEMDDADLCQAIVD